MRWLGPASCGALLLFLAAQPAACGSEFSAGASDGGAGKPPDGGSGTGGASSGGSAGNAGTGGAGTGGGGSGGAGSGGVSGVGGGPDSDAGESDARLDAGGCLELTALTFQNGDFESGALLPGWGGAPNPPYYSEVTLAAARNGFYGVEFNDTGTGTPGIQQPVLVGLELVSQQVTVEAWVRPVSFPSIRLLVWANNDLGNHIGSAFADTRADIEGWQLLSATITIPPGTDHLMVMLISATATADGVAHADDVRICMDGACSSC